jgi:hypothetical protein
MTASTSANAHRWWVLALCLAFGAALSVALGPDIFWDTRNYHLYNAWAFLHDRYGLDITPAGMQSYFSPLPDLSYFLLATGPLNAWPRVLAAVQGLWFGVLVYVLLCIARALATLQQRRFGVADVCAALIGATGTMAVSQAGSTTNEIQLAVLLLLGLYLLMPLLDASRPSRPLGRALLAGLCCGVAAGLKPTAVVYPPAMGLGLLVALGASRPFAWRASATYAASAACAFLLVYGVWGWHLYQATGNPIFPMFNQVFHSPLTVATGGTDGQFRPRNIAQWLFYPFYWLHKQQGVVTEVAFADPRYALAMTAIAALLAARLFRPTTDARGRSATQLLAIFAGVAYLLWMALFSILRYAVPFEALTGLLMLCAIQAWLGRSGEKTQRVQTVSIVLLLLISLGCSTYPSWWRGAYADRALKTDVSMVEPGSLIVLAGSPDGYLATQFPHAENIQFVGLTWFTRTSQGQGLWTLTQQRLREHQGPMYLVRRDDPDNASELALLAEMLPQHHAADCRPIHSNMEVSRSGKDLAKGLSLCRLVMD